MAGTGELESDMVFLGLTRPPMLFGVSYVVVVAYFFTCMMIFVLTSDFKAFLAMPAIHGLAYFFTQGDPLFLELRMMKYQKCNKCRNKWYHGMTNSYDIM